MDGYKAQKTRNENVKVARRFAERAVTRTNAGRQDRTKSAPKAVMQANWPQKKARIAKQGAAQQVLTAGQSHVVVFWRHHALDLPHWVSIATIHDCNLMLHARSRPHGDLELGVNLRNHRRHRNRNRSSDRFRKRRLISGLFKGLLLTGSIANPYCGWTKSCNTQRTLK